MHKTILERFTFRLDYSKKDDLKTAIVYFTSVAVLLLLLGYFGSFPLLSLTLYIGSGIYFITSLYFLDKLINNKYANYIFSFIYAIIFVSLIFLMTVPINTTENKLMSFLVSIALILLPASFSDEIIEFLKKKIFLVTLPITVNLNFTSFNWTNIISSKIPYYGALQSFFSANAPFALTVIVATALILLKFIKTILKIILILLIIWTILKYAGVM